MKLPASFIGISLCTGFLPCLASAQTGEELYQQYCSTCHGIDLEGGIGSNLVDKVWTYGRRENRLMFRNIKFGLPLVGMPGLQESMSDPQIESVIDYIFEKEGTAGVPDPPLPTSLTSKDYDIEVKVVAQDILEKPWGIVFIDENKALVTDKIGKLFMLIDDKIQEEAIADVPKVLYYGQGGMLDVAIDPDYDRNGWVYLCYSHVLDHVPDDAKDKPNMTRVVRGKIEDGAWTKQEVLFEAPHDKYKLTRHHYGSRLVFDDDGHLFFSICDRGTDEQAQDVRYPNGKIHRINKDGSIPEDNPFLDTEDAIPSVFSYGHRNPQGLSLHPGTRELWATEHGPMGGDELNKPQKGLNYGWPEITHGLNYDGKKLSEFTAKPDMEQPVHQWTPSIAVCGIDFHKGHHFPKWNNSLLVTGLRYEQVSRLEIENGIVIEEEIILKSHGRVRDVGVSPSGEIYVLLSRPGLILKLSQASR
jgi:glucose/arabinose dehydrogenase